MDMLIGLMTPIVVALLGYIFNKRLGEFKSKIDFSSMVRAEQYKARIDHYDKKLRLFLNPLLTCIEFDNSIWERLSMHSNQDDVFPQELSIEIEQEHLLKNLVNASDLIRENLHLVELDSAIHKKLIEFIRHVAVYQSIRNAGVDGNPIDFNVPFPEGLEDLVRKEYTESLAEYERLIRFSS